MTNFSPLEIIKKAVEGGYAIGQFNVGTVEVLKAVMAAAKNLNSPVIIGTSEGERDFWGLRQIVYLVKAWQQESGLPIILNADHSKSYETAKEAFDFGYDAIHIDGSQLPFEQNIEVTKKVVDYVKSKNHQVVVEGELGYIRGASQFLKEKIEVSPEDLTKPDQASEFIERTGIDLLAPAIGNLHGVLAKEAGEERLDLERLKEIKDKIKIPLVLHGASGQRDEEIAEAIKSGIVKININTSLRIAFVESLKKVFAESSETTPYKFMIPVVEELQRIVEDRIRLFVGS